MYALFSYVLHIVSGSDIYNHIIGVLDGSGNVHAPDNQMKTKLFKGIEMIRPATHTPSAGPESASRSSRAWIAPELLSSRNISREPSSVFATIPGKRSTPAKYRVKDK